jgi:hypothetical protein
MATSDENGFVKRGFFLLGTMAGLTAIVMAILFYRPEQPLPIESKNLPAKASGDGWKIRYNATIALLRRGSDQVPWPIVREMLDENQQLKNCEYVHDQGRTIPDESLARSFVITALKAVAEWQRKQTEAGKKIDATDALPAIRIQVDELAKSPIPELQIQAEKTRQALGK